MDRTVTMVVTTVTAAMTQLLWCFAMCGSFNSTPGMTLVQWSSRFQSTKHTRCRGCVRYGSVISTFYSHLRGQHYLRSWRRCLTGYIRRWAGTEAGKDKALGRRMREWFLVRYYNIDNRESTQWRERRGWAVRRYIIQRREFNEIKSKCVSAWSTMCCDRV